MNNKDWEVQILRFTGFLPPSLKPNHKAWWKIITGDEPEIRIEKPKENMIEDSGRFNLGLNEGNLKLTIKPDRIDLLYDSILNLNSPEVPSLGNYGLIVNDYLENLISKLILGTDDFPPLTRIAFGAVLFQPAEPFENVFELLSSYIKCIDFASVSKNSDFQYTTNRPRDVEIDGNQITINRLMKWNARISKIIKLNINTNIPQFSSYPAAFLELDVNTAVRKDLQQSFEGDLIINVLKELISLANEISKEGDIE